jgi:hypothetical protein
MSRHLACKLHAPKLLGWKVWSRHFHRRMANTEYINASRHDPSVRLAVCVEDTPTTSSGLVGAAFDTTPGNPQLVAALHAEANAC